MGAPERGFPAVPEKDSIAFLSTHPSTQARLSRVRSAPMLASSVPRSMSAARLLAPERGRPNPDAFLLARPQWKTTFDEHTWHGKPPVTACHVDPTVQPRLEPAKSQASFSVAAYKRGYLKPSVEDAVKDKTVTQFVDAHPTSEQQRLAQAGYKNLCMSWAEYVRFENERQRTTLMRRAPVLKRRTGALTRPY